jgi:hypothetical protein
MTTPRHTAIRDGLSRSPWSCVRLGWAPHHSIVTSSRGSKPDAHDCVARRDLGRVEVVALKHVDGTGDHRFEEWQVIARAVTPPQASRAIRSHGRSRPACSSGASPRRSSRPTSGCRGTGASPIRRGFCLPGPHSGVPTRDFESPGHRSGLRASPMGPVESDPPEGGKGSVSAVTAMPYPQTTW